MSAHASEEVNPRFLSNDWSQKTMLDHTCQSSLLTSLGNESISDHSYIMVTLPNHCLYEDHSKLSYVTTLIDFLK